IGRPWRLRSERASALTTPADTVDSNPNGLPTATTSWPARRRWVLPRRAYGSAPACARSTARSVAGSRPVTTAGTVRPSTNVTRACVTRCTTCSLVSRSPSGVTTTPEPAPPRARSASAAPPTYTLTTAGPTSSTAPTTAAEYASRGSVGDEGSGGTASSIGEAWGPAGQKQGLAAAGAPAPALRPAPPIPARI